MTVTYPSGGFSPEYFVSGSSTLSQLSYGNHNLTVQGETTFNTPFNKGVSFNVDTVNPTISVLSLTAKTYTKTIIELDFTVSEQVSWIDYTLDGQEAMAITGNTTLTGLSEGSHCIVVYANDTAGNIGSSAPIYFSIAKESETQPEPQEPTLFPKTLVVASIASVAAIGAGLAIYFKKRNGNKNRINGTVFYKG
jgi:hypothetical protein